MDNGSMARGVSMYVPHGGGPMPLLGTPNQIDLATFLRDEARAWLDKPSAIVLVTAHWTTDDVVISGAAQHPLLFDYYGFPPEAYTLSYSAPGSPDVAKRVQAALSSAGVSASIDCKRGWDHGVFVPLLLMAPDANIPVVQVSVLADQDPAALIRYGRALAPLRDDNIAIVGSGMSFHNMTAWKGGRANLQFESALAEAAGTLPAQARIDKFLAWRSWPGAVECHPARATEHFSPMLVVLGAAGDDDDAQIEDIACLGVHTTACRFR